MTPCCWGCVQKLSTLHERWGSNATVEMQVLATRPGKTQGIRTVDHALCRRIGARSWSIVRKGEIHSSALRLPGAYVGISTTPCVSFIPILTLQNFVVPPVGSCSFHDQDGREEAIKAPRRTSYGPDLSSFPKDRSPMCDRMADLPETP